MVVPLDTGLGVVLALLLVLGNGFFVAAEFAIVKVRQTQLQPLASRSARARLALHLSGHLDLYLAACQVGVTLTSLSLGWIGEPAVAALIEPALVGVFGAFAPTVAHGLAIGLAFALISALHIVLGELAPKSIAIQRALPTALFVAYPLHWFSRAMLPFITLLNALGNALVRALGLSPSSPREMTHSVAELALILDAASNAGVVTPEERDVARRALTFGERTVRSVMVPRTEVVTVAESATLEELLALSRDRPFTRLPVHKGRTREIVGVVHLRDIALARDAKLTAGDLKRPVAVIPENVDLLDALAMFRRDRARLAVVLDEYGDTAGIVTVGAIAEQLIGIADEFAVPRTLFEERPDGSVIIDGLAPLPDVAERLGIVLDGVPAETIAGLVVHELGRMPVPGDSVAVRGIRFDVLEVDGRRIDRVVARRPAASEAATR